MNYTEWETGTSSESGRMSNIDSLLQLQNLVLSDRVVKLFPIMNRYSPKTNFSVPTPYIKTIKTENKQEKQNIKKNVSGHSI